MLLAILDMSRGEYPPTVPMHLSAERAGPQPTYSSICVHTHTGTLKHYWSQALDVLTQPKQLGDKESFYWREAALKASALHPPSLEIPVKQTS